MAACRQVPESSRTSVVAIESPDNARLYDLSDLDLGPVFRDQKLFGTDNPNVNNTTASAFGAGKFFALSSNNGLIAMNLNNAFNPDSGTLDTRNNAQQSPKDVQAALCPGASAPSNPLQSLLVKLCPTS